MTGSAIKKVLEHHNIIPKTIAHYNENLIGLYFKPDKKVNDMIKNTGDKWSASLQCWYLPKNKRLLQKFAIELAEISGYAIPGCEESKEIVRILELKNYSSSTIKTYKDAFVNFSEHFDERGLNTINKREMEDYLLNLRKRKLSETTIHSAVNAIKFYYEQVLKMGKENYQLQDQRSQ